jgi:peptidyl-tRNA hydrolase
MYTRSTTSIFYLLLLSTLIKIDMSIIGESQLGNLKNSAQSPTLIARVVHDADDRSLPKEEKT